MTISKKYKDLCLSYLEELVRINTVNTPGNEEICALKVQELLEKEGIFTHLMEVAPGRSNLYSDILESASKRKEAPAIILTGHMDTVPVDNGWNTDPFTLTQKDGALFGRGACDMKGGLAAMMAAAVYAKDQGSTVPFRLAFVVDEEIYGTGSKAFASAFTCADPAKSLGPVRFCVIGEPTENRIHIAHRGAIRYHVTVKGTSGHAGKPHLCNDPVHQAAKICQAVEAVCEDLKQVHHEVLPPPTMCVTEIFSGIKDNVIPEVCTLTIDTRPGIHDTVESFEALIRDKIEVLGGLKEGTEVTFDAYIDTKAGHIESDSDAALCCRKAFREAFGEEAQVEAFPACCDQTYFTEKGVSALLYGPGSIDQAHTRNEYVTKDQLMQSLYFYCHLITDEGKQE